MMKTEAEYLSRLLGSHGQQDLSTLMNIGSSTAFFRKVAQPHIDQLVFGPLLARGVEVVHVDIKEADGVDVVADIFNGDDLALLRKIKPKFTVCSNLIEHVTDPKSFAERLSSIVPKGSRIFVSVPFSFPYHPDPIDNRFRASPSEIASLFPSFTVLESSICEGGTLGNKIWRKPSLAGVRIVRTLLPFYSFQGWLSCVDHWRWLFMRYKVSCVLLEH